ncbi:MAG: EAL domain-containing protein [Acidimicrobiales bacterium]|jgi:EAL domain-containing protein (putative c-di-GMP-specific phosphodiesterase class I)
MRKNSPLSDDLFIAKKSVLSRGRNRTITSARQSRHVRHDEERQRDERGKLIRATIANRSLETHFQPIVDLRSGTAVGTEALARFDQAPFQSPDLWFAEAADLGLGVELELTAVGLALEQLHSLPSTQYLSLNASVETIMSDPFRAILSAAPAERIVLELTEHTPITDYDAFARSIDELRSSGVRLAVDDAGSGFSSFVHILNLKPDIIKLDIALTRGIDKDPARQALGRALLNFGLEAYRNTIVAEGIETQGELAMLRSLGCPIGQGFLLGRPRRMAQRPRVLPLLNPEPYPVLEATS